ADHAETSACHHLRGNAVERMHLPGRLQHAFARQRVALRQILHFEQRRFGGWRDLVWHGHAPKTPAASAIDTSVLMQRTPWPAPTSTAAGGATRQRSKTIAQRSAKVQPEGRSASSGTVPAMVFSRVPFRAPRRGRARNRPCV